MFVGDSGQKSTDLLNLGKWFAGNEALHEKLSLSLSTEWHVTLVMIPCCDGRELSEFSCLLHPGGDDIV